MSLRYAEGQRRDIRQKPQSIEGSRRVLHAYASFPGQDLANKCLGTNRILSQVGASYQTRIDEEPFHLRLSPARRPIASQFQGTKSDLEPSCLFLPVGSSAILALNPVHSCPNLSLPPNKKGNLLDSLATQNQ